jgi:dihydroorotase-like cyclic amidohydrolase
MNGKIESIRDKPPSDKYYTVIDYGNAVISPGVVDVHAHFNEPGREDWEGRAANDCIASSAGTHSNHDRALANTPLPRLAQCNHQL